MHRRFLVTLLAIIASITVSAGAYASLQSRDDGITATVPDIEFTVYTVQDPYLGLLSAPTTLDPTKRYIGAEVGIVNNSQFPLTLSLGSIRLRDTDGNEYSAGSAYGEDLRLNARTMAALDQARGWVWFVLPIDAQIDHIVFIPSTLEIRLPSDELPYASTPVASPTS